MTERWGEAFAEWAEAHRVLAAMFGLASLAAPVVIGMLLAGFSTALSLVAGAAVVVGAFALLAAASVITGRPVMLSPFERRTPHEPGSAPVGGEGLWSDGGGGGGGGDGGGGGGGGGS